MSFTLSTSTVGNPIICDRMSSGSWGFWIRLVIQFRSLSQNLPSSIVRILVLNHRHGQLFSICHSTDVAVRSKRLRLLVLEHTSWPICWKVIQNFILVPMRAYFSATLKVDPLAFTQTSSYCSNILKFGKNGTTKRERNKLLLSVFRARKKRDLENRLVSFHGRFYHKTRNIEPPSLKKLTAMKNLDAGKPVGCLPALLDPLGSLLEFLTGFPKCTVRFRVSPWRFSRYW